MWKRKRRKHQVKVSLQKHKPSLKTGYIAQVIREDKIKRTGLN
jgi:hypothetical protein